MCKTLAVLTFATVVGCLTALPASTAIAQSSDTGTLENAYATVGVPWTPSGIVKTAYTGCCPTSQACSFYLPESRTFLHARQTGVELQSDGYLYHLPSISSYTFQTPGTREVDMYATCPPQRYGDEPHARNFRLSVEVAPASGSRPPREPIARCPGGVPMIAGHCVRA